MDSVSARFEVKPKVFKSQVKGDAGAGDGSSAQVAGSFSCQVRAAKM